MYCMFCVQGMFGTEGAKGDKGEPGLSVRPNHTPAQSLIVKIGL